MTPKSFEEEGLLSSDERNDTKRAVLVLEDGTRYSGISFGADCNASTSGEVLQLNDLFLKSFPTSYIMCNCKTI